MGGGMTPILAIIGGCNGAGKTTLALDLLPQLGLRRFLNADEIARGLSPLEPSLSTFRAGRLLVEEAHALVEAKVSFAVESTLSGSTHLGLIRMAKDSGYRFVLHFVVLGSATQAVARVALRVRLGGHPVPEPDVRRRHARGLRHFLDDYAPLADEWVVWDNSEPPCRSLADNGSHTLDQISAMLDPKHLQEAPVREMSESVRLGLEAGRVSTARWIDYYKRMGIKVTAQMTLAPEQPRRWRRNNGSSAEPTAPPIGRPPIPRI